MPGGRHAAQHHRQPHSRRDRVPARPPRRKRTARYGTAGLVAVALLLVVPLVMRVSINHDKDSAALSQLNCSSAPRLVADDSVTTLLGVNATGASQLAAATAEFGHLPIIRVYYAGVPSASEWTTGATGINKSAVVLSFNPSPAEVLSGADDAGLAHFFDTAPQGHAIYYSFYPEPEAHIRAGEFTFAQYKAAWARVVTIADAAHNPYLHSTLILQGQDGRPGDEYNFKNYLPSGGVISTLGWDAYPDGTVDDEDPQPSPPAQFMGPDVAASKSVGLPFGFAEFALGTQTGRPQWLTDVASYMQSSGALFGTLFNAKGFPWMVLHDSASIQTWRAAVARSASGTPAPDPSAAPTSPAATPTSTAPAPTPAPSPATPAMSSPTTQRLGITELTVVPPKVSTVGPDHVKIRFKLSQAANVRICMFNSQGQVVSQLDRRKLPAGWAASWYYGYDRHHRPLRAGRYETMVIASNATGTATAQRGFTLT